MNQYLSPFNTKEGFTGVPLVAPIPKEPPTAGPIVLDPTRMSSNNKPIDILQGILKVIEEKTDSNPSPGYTSLLKNLIVTEKLNLDELIRTAKQLNPVVQKITPLDTAYDAAFESAAQRPVPAAGATLQGFALLLLVISYVSLVLVSVIAVNTITGSLMAAGKTLAALLALGLIGFAILFRFG